LIVTKEGKRIYLFILCPPGMGSTILLRLISTSPTISTFLLHPSAGWAGEGQIFINAATKRVYRENRWDPDYALDMDTVSSNWDKHWDKSKLIHGDKSPPTLCRANMFEDHFKQRGDVYFICMMRDPYMIHEDARFYVKMAEYQKCNLETLENVLYISYEDLCT